MHCVCWWLLCLLPACVLMSWGLEVMHTSSMEEDFCLHFSFQLAEEFGIYLVKWRWRWQERGDLLVKAFEYYVENYFLNQPLLQSSFVMLSESQKPVFTVGAQWPALLCTEMARDLQGELTGWAAAVLTNQSLWELKPLQWFCKAASPTCAAQILQKCALNIAHSAS